MSAQIKYAYLKGHTWLYRRHYPKDVALALGQQALKQSLKTRDAATARVRAAELNARYETQVAEVRSLAEEALSAPRNSRTAPQWATNPEGALDRLRASLADSGAVLDRPDFNRLTAKKKILTGDRADLYLRHRSSQLRHGGFKSVRYSVELFASRYGERSLCSLGRDDGREFLGLIAKLSPLVGKSASTRGLSLDGLLSFSENCAAKITVRTQKRIWSQVNHFLDWCVYEGALEANPRHLIIGDRRDNLMDEWDRQANGVDYRQL